MNCPHCQAPSESGHTFCMHCGLALPGDEAAAPRIIPAKEYAATRPGRTLQVHELFLLARRGSGVLMAYAVLHLIGVIMLLLGVISYESTREAEQPEAPIATISVAAAAVLLLFIVLALWARRNPFPASIAGLVMISTFGLLGVLSTIGNISSAVTDEGPESLGWRIVGFVCGVGFVILIVGIFIAYLAKAIAAGARHRALARLMMAETTPPPLGNAA